MNTSKPFGPGSAPGSRPRGPTTQTPIGGHAPLQPSLKPDITERAENVASQTASAAASLSADLKHAAKTAKRAVQEQTSEFAADIGHELSQTAEEQKTRGVEAMHAFCHAINTAAGELETQSPRVAQYVRDAA